MAVNLGYGMKSQRKQVEGDRQKGPNYFSEVPFDAQRCAFCAFPLFAS